MTEPFKCPEASEKAVETVLRVLFADTSKLPEAIAAGLAVDVPAIVRAEVERALEYHASVHGASELWPEDLAYLAERFGEYRKVVEG